jgi:putative NADH-flavin reductase
MKIAVVGATGATGRRVVEHALTQGHFVTAVARHPERLSSADRLSLVRGDVLSPLSLTGALTAWRSSSAASDQKKTYRSHWYAVRCEFRGVGQCKLCVDDYRLAAERFK